MNFHSLQQYFYKLYGTLFLLILIPLAVVIISPYARSTEPMIWIAQLPDHQIVVYVVCGVVINLWVLALAIFFNRLRNLRTVISLGERLSAYANLTIVRSILFSVGLLLLALGYMLVESRWLMIIFFTSLVVPIVLWPFPSRVCSHLKLKGDERMVVYNIKDDM
ncbi:MAG: hypothetical protein KF687_15555 [Cyclobacteriaceae bacterium]|nr:hypothetical protein [Cyclobacteriaceae bacterium]